MAAMDDLRAPLAYIAVEQGTPIYSSDGQQLGTLEHVLADVDADVFDGIIIDTSLGPGGWRFVDAPEVEEIHERGVLLKIDAATADQRPAREATPAELRADPADPGENAAMEKLRRA